MDEKQKLLRGRVANGSPGRRRPGSCESQTGERRPSQRSSSGPPSGRGFASVNIVSYNPGHDGAVAHLRDGHLVSSIEAEKNSNYRYTPIASRDLLDAFGRLEQVPDVVCTGGWWPREARPTGHLPTLGIAALLKTESPWTVAA